jgi:asparagine synthase (glutamine-hydrolysing)
MCGILGRLGLNKVFSEDDLSVFNNALLLQRHRGPDGHGTYFKSKYILGHRRLSVIDVGHQSDQPFVSSCGNYVLTFNGEIYNYIELRDKLIQQGYSFKTNSDTEVLLNSFIDKGIDCVNDFIGMFSFAIVDRDKNETYIARDRLGVKPLYYIQNDKELIFSSEIKSILHIDESYIQLNKKAISSYMSFRYPITHETFFKGVMSLPPANYLKIKSGNVSMVEYWNFSKFYKEQKNDYGEEYYLSKVKELIESSVYYRMISDVPFGAFLSGGVDSSIITSIMSNKSDEAIKTYSIGFDSEGYNEFKYAKIISNEFKTSHHEIIMSGSDYMKIIEELISFKDAPLSVPNEVPLYKMCKELKKKITVVLSGEGADEIFGGYGRIFRSPYDYERLVSLEDMQISDLDKKNFYKSFLKKYAKDGFSNELSHFMDIYSYTSVDEKYELLDSSCNISETEDDLYKYFKSLFDELEGETYVNKMMYVFEKVHLLGLLNRLDTTSMAASVEARVPFVDHRLVEFAATIPIKYKLKWSKNKDSMPFDLMSSDISELYDTPKYILKKSYEKHIPDNILYRKKMGFPVPLNTWIGGSFQRYAKKILLSDNAKSRSLYNINNVKLWLDSDKLTKHEFSMKIWMLINLELFIIKYFD